MKLEVIAKSLALEINRNNWPLIERFSHQFLYGAREALIDFTGIPKNSLFLGVIQHGLSLPRGQYGNHPAPRVGLKRAPIWLASSAAAQDLRKRGAKTVSAIGSVWNYMRQTTPQDEAQNFNRSPRGDILFFPDHFGGGINPYHYVDQHVELLLKNLRKRFPKEKITICISSQDIFNGNWLTRAQQAGFNIVSVGQGATYPVWYPAPSRMNFLRNFKNLVDAHERCLFQCISSGIFYAVDLGKPVMLDRLNIELPLDPEKDHDMRDLVNKFPDIQNDFILNSGLKKYSDELLGKDSTLSREKLIDRLTFFECPELNFYLQIDKKIGQYVNVTY